jgi:predicted MFS family arabinose efflux permease
MRLWGQLGFGAGSSLVGSLLSLYPADGASKSTSPSTSAPVPSDPTILKVMDSIETGIEIASNTNAETDAISSVKTYNILVEFTRDILGKTRPLKGYEWAFLAHAVLSIPTYLCIRAFRPAKSDATIDQKKQKQKGPEETQGTNIMNGLRLVSKNSDALVFFFLVFVIGTSSGCIENFAYVRVREVGGTGNNMGILRLVSSLAGAPMFWFSGPMTEALGNDVVLVLSLLAYVARFFNYAWMKHPYHALPAEALRGITFAMFWSSGSMYAHKISPPGMKATMLLTMNAMYGGLGQSLGAIIGGKLQTNVGTAKTFIYSGIFDFCFVGVLVMYLLTRSERAFT